MSKITPKQLLSYERVEELVRGVVSNSISYGIIQTAESAVKSEKIMKEISGSLEKIVNLYKNNDFISEEARVPIKELEVFWHYVSFVAKYEFEKVDEEFLFKGPEYPIDLINQIHEKSQIYGKTKLYEKLIEPIEKKINNLISIQNRK